MVDAGQAAQVVEAWDDLDYLLRIEVASANRTGGDFRRGLTLFLGDVVVSGDLVPGLVYAEYAESISGIAREAGIVAKYGASVGTDMTVEFVGETRHVHLRDVTVWGTTGSVKLEYWRGLIERVDGWAYGVPDAAA